MTENSPPPGSPAPRKRGAGFWIAVAAGALLLVCGCGGAALWWFGRDWIAIASAPEKERMELLSKKLEEVSAEGKPAVDAFLAAVDDGRVDDAWALASPAFQASTTREQFGTLVATVRDVMGRCLSRQLRNLNTKANVGGPTVSSLVYAAKFEKGEGTIKLDLESAGSKWLVRGWHTESPLFLDAMKKK